MVRTKVLIPSALALTALAGCTGTKETVYVPMPITAAPTTVTLPSITVPPTTAAQVDLEDIYLNGVRTQTSNLWALTDEQLLQLGYMTCEHFRNGGSNDDLINAIIVAGIDNGASEGIITDMAGATGVAVAVLCPEFAWKLG